MGTLRATYPRKNDYIIEESCESSFDQSKLHDLNFAKRLLVLLNANDTILASERLRHMCRLGNHDVRCRITLILEQIHAIMFSMWLSIIIRVDYFNK